MQNRFRLSFLASASALAIALSACSTPNKQPLYQDEHFDASSSPYTHTFRATSAATCEAARRALLSQGYIASASQNDTVDGSKNFQPNNETHVVIAFHIVCVGANVDDTSSIAYVNAIQDRYALKKSNSSASVGLSLFGSLSLPIGSSSDAMVKIASETIPAGTFYDRYFKLVDHFLKIDPQRRDIASIRAAEKEHVEPLPEPAAEHGARVKLKEPAEHPTPAASPASAVSAVSAASSVSAASPASAASSTSAAPSSAPVEQAAMNQPTPTPGSTSKPATAPIVTVAPAPLALTPAPSAAAIAASNALAASASHTPRAAAASAASGTSVVAPASGAAASPASGASGVSPAAAAPETQPASAASAPDAASAPGSAAPAASATSPASAPAASGTTGY